MNLWMTSGWIHNREGTARRVTLHEADPRPTKQLLSKQIADRHWAVPLAFRGGPFLTKPIADSTKPLLIQQIADSHQQFFSKQIADSHSRPFLCFSEPAFSDRFRGPMIGPSLEIAAALRQWVAGTS